MGDKAEPRQSGTRFRPLVAFDFDGVIADDESESVFKKNNDIDECC